MELHAREKFNQSLFDFLKEKIEGESLYDYEVAELLDAKPLTVGSLRRSMGLKRRNGFRRRFEARYGPGSVDAFKTLIDSPDSSLTDVAGRFGFSRQYAWIAYKGIFGIPYAEAFKKKCTRRRKRKEKKEWERSHQSKKLSEFQLVEKEMKTRGISARLIRQGKAYRFVTSENKISLRYTRRAVKIGRKNYFKISNVGCADIDCDFCICRCKKRKRNIHYIIPRDCMPRTTLSLMADATHGQSKYAKFREAWHLLEGKNRNPADYSEKQEGPVFFGKPSIPCEPIHIQEANMKQQGKNRKNGVWSVEAKDQWKSKGAGLINFQSRLELKNTVTEEIDQLVADRFGRS
jgi:hypothetical protein